MYAVTTKGGGTMTQTQTPIICSECGRGAYAQQADTDTAECVACGHTVVISTDVQPYVDVTEALVWTSAGILAYVSTDGPLGYLADLSTDGWV